MAAQYKGYQAPKLVNLIAGEALTADVYEIVTMENDGGVAKVIKASAVTETVVGVIAENLDATNGADGETVSVALISGGGVLYMKAGAAITAGDLVVADSTAGRVASGGANVAALVADAFAFGIALNTAADGDIFPVLVMPISSATET